MLIGNDVEANDNRFKGAYDPGQPFETLVQQIDEAQDFAEATGQPYSPAQLVSNANQRKTSQGSG
jgi:hypothetical protein